MDEVVSNLEKLLLLKRSFEYLNVKQFTDSLNIEMYKLLDEALYKILDILPASIYWKDINGVYLGANRYMLDIVGLSSRSELLGKTDSFIVSPEYLAKIQYVDLSVIRTGVAALSEETPHLTDGTVSRTFLSSKMPLYGHEQKIVGLIGVSIDITEQKKAQEQERLEKRKREDAENISKEEKSYRQAVSVYSGSMSHDLKNPLLTSSLANEMNRIFLQRIQEKYKIDSQDLMQIYQKMDIIQENHEKMREMIDSSNQLIQDISSDHPQLIQQEFSAYSLIKESLSNYFEDTQSGLIQFEMPVDFRLSTNKITFFRIMFNLIDNAKRQIKLKNRGQIFISTEEEKKYFLIKIKDTAGGVTPDLVDNIFNLYKNKQVQGTGLGLQAVSKLMENQKGLIQVQFIEPEYIEFILGFKK